MKCPRKLNFNKLIILSVALIVVVNPYEELDYSNPIHVYDYTGDEHKIEVVEPEAHPEIVSPTRFWCEFCLP